jgi:alpha-beta hydrolase superfamily lysophospholipase
MTGHDRGEFDGRQGQVNWRAWLPDSPAVAVVVIAHGVAEHSGRYAYLGTKLADAGFAVYAVDHHGHGLSAGHRANIGRMSAIADDLAQMLTLAGRLTPGRPRFLLGHSMGALVTLYLTTRSPLDLAGVVVSGVPLVLPAVNPMLRTFAPLISAVTPNAGSVKIDSLQISRDITVVRDYDTDPLNYRGKLPARTGYEVMTGAQSVARRLGTFAFPLLILHGSADIIALPAGARVLSGGVASTDVTVKMYDGLYHEVFNEPERDQVIADTVAWLGTHLPAAQ